MMQLATISLLCPLMLIITALSGEYASLLPIKIDESQATLIRVGALLVVCAFSMVVGVKSRLNCRVDKYLALGLLVWALGAVISVLVNSSQNWHDSLLRLFIVLAVGMSVFIISGQTKTESDLFATVRNILLSMMVVILILVFSFFAYGPFLEWSFRLGPPLNPRVAAEIICVSIFCIFCLEKDNVPNRNALFVALKILLFLLLVWTGGRAALAITTVFFVMSFIISKRMSLLGKVALASLAIILSGISGLHFASDFQLGDMDSIYSRTDISSGRFDLWAGVIEQSDSFFVGNGDRYEATAKNDEGIRLHNGLLETVVSYGVLSLLGAMILYGRILVIAIRQKSRICFATSYLVSIIFSEILTGTSIIGNVADAFFYVSIYVFSAISATRDLEKR